VLDKILPAGSISCHGGAEIAAAIVVGIHVGLCAGYFYCLLAGIAETAN